RMLHLRPVRDRTAAPHRDRQHHVRRRLSAFGLQLAAHPQVACRAPRRCAGRRGPKDRRAQCPHAVPVLGLRQPVTEETMNANGSDLMFDPFKPGPRDQLPRVLSELRERFPVYRTSSDIWVLSRFDDVKTVQWNPPQFSSRPNPYEGTAPPDDEMKPEVLDRLLALAAGIPVDMAEMASAKTIAAADPPQHTRMRRIVSRGFTPPRIKEMATAIEGIVQRCVAGIEGQSTFDVVERLAVPLPVEMICHILGIDRSE